MSAKPEYIFLGTWRIISQQQIRLRPGNIKKTKYLKSQIKTELIIEWRKELILGINIVAENQAEVQKGVQEGVQEGVGDGNSDD